MVWWKIRRPILKVTEKMVTVTEKKNIWLPVKTMIYNYL